MSKEARLMGRKVRQTFNRNQEKFWSEAFKPKPKWIPVKVWMWLIRLILKE